jgi:rhomboid protease GluP
VNENPSYPESAEPVHQQPPPPERPVSVALPQSAPYVTYTIIGITIFVYLLQLVTQFIPFIGFDLPAAFFIKSNALIKSGQVWRLFTPALLHGSLTHIGFNMYALYVFGIGLERHFGHNRFLLLYILGAFSGNVMSFLFSDANSLGASTSIFGLIGAQGIFLYQNRRMFAGQFSKAIQNVIFIVAINLFLGLSPGIDNWGHVGGLIGGLMFTWFAGPVWEIEGIQPMLHLVDQRSSRDLITGAAMVLIIFGGLAMWGIVR